MKFQILATKTNGNQRILTEYDNDNTKDHDVIEFEDKAQAQEFAEEFAAACPYTDHCEVVEKEEEA